MTATVLTRDAHTTAVRLDTGRGQFTAETSASVPIDTGAAPWVPATYALAMRIASSLEIRTEDGVPANVDREQRAGAAAAGAIFASWFPEVDAVSMDAGLFGNDVVRVPGEGRGVGCFFSLGVDSFHAVRKHLDEITHLIFVLGMDLDDHDGSAADLAVERAQAAATDLGKELIVVRTTVRRVSDPLRVPWPRLYFGPALAHVALCLAPTLAAVIVPSSPPITSRHGSHPYVDPHWSSSRVRLVHDDDDAWRPTKIAEISDWAPAMRYVRVCFQEQAETYNCERCFKCVSTALCIRVAGGSSEVLSPDVDPDTIRAMPLAPEHSHRMEWIRDRLREQGDDPAVLAALDDSIAGAHRRSRLQGVADRVNEEIYLRL
ncbi:hypothetical protein [Rhodococcoides corynebacterioides]|uniref:hypothetical protein n=1 Tax=Rhodococcoides corynebacterioides TaxID=53972 RepID=UPI000834AC02|nr:hypothetical protein [Rhodococcus corynebacterioides]